jgi:ComF family protein
VIAVEEAEAGAEARGALADLRRWAMANFRYLSDLILPPVCLHCHQPVAFHGVLCPACWREVRFITPPLCDRLGLPLPYATEAPALSAAARRRPPVYGRARAVAQFDGVIRNLVHSFKYADRHEASSFFARLMRAAGGELIREADLLVPVPLHRTRLWSRRYNQAAILARRLSEITGLPLGLTLLRRVRQTQSQVGLTSHERRENVAAAFAVAPGAETRLHGKRILLIDDVITTGATLGACAETLKRAGAAEVDCLALAMATHAPSSLS